MKAFSSIGGGARPVEVKQLGWIELARADRGGRCGRAQVQQLGAHSALAPGLGTAKPVSVALGCVRQRHLARQRRLGLIGTQHVDDVNDVGGRLHAVEVKLTDLLDVIKHLRQFGRHPLGLLVTELEPREARNVVDLFAGEHRGEF